jgi:hypothetical protein
MANGTVTVEIFSRSWTSYGTITSAFAPKGTFKQNDAGDGIFVFPIYDTPAKTLVKYNRIAVVTVEDTGGGAVNPTVCAFHIQSVMPRRVQSGDYDGYVIEVSGSGILAELQWDNIGYSTISNGSQGPTNTWVSDCLVYAQESWSIFLMSSLTTAANAYLQAAGESVWDALLECSAQCGRVVAYAPSFATQTTGTKGREILFVSSPLVGNPVYDWDELNLVASNPDAGEVEILNIEPLEDVFEIATRVTIYGAGIGADVLTIAAAEGNVTVPSGFSVDWTNSVITNTAMEAETDQPVIHRLKQLGHIKPEDNEDATAIETAAIQLFWAGITFLRDRQVERRNFYKVVFIGEPGLQYTVGQLVNIVYAHTSPINSSGTAATTNVIDINGNFVVHEMTIEVPNDGQHKGVRLITMVVGSPITSDTYARSRASGEDIVVAKLKEHDEVLRHATASYAPSTPGGGTGTYATADAPYLVLGNTTNLTNERLFVAGAGLTPVDAGANSTYTVNVVAADTSLTINADSMQVRLATTSGLTISTGLMIDDSIAGAGLTITSKVLAVGAGDGIDVAADSIAVDVTDIIGNGLVEAATNNIALGTPGSITSTSTNAVTASSHTHAIDSTIALSAVTITAGAGLTGGGDLTTNRTINVATADTSMTINADSIQVRLATTSGLTISTGLMIDDSIAGAGLTIASKVLAVGSGDGIDVAADSIAVDVTDIIGNGLVEEVTNNIALGTPGSSTATSTNAVTASSHTHAIDSTIARSAVTITAGAGLTGGGDLTTNRTINVATADTSMTINADSIQVRLATTSGLTISTGLMIDDSIAGAGLTIASKVLAVGSGDGIDVAADSIAVDVTDLIGNGLVEEATNNIALGTPGSLTATSTNAVTASSHTHAIDSTIARSAVTISAGNGLTGGGDLTTNRTITMGTPSTLTAATSNAVTTTSHTHAITTTNNGAASTIVAMDSSGYVRFGNGSGAAQRRVHIVGTDGAVASFPSSAMTGTESLVVENAGANSSMAIISAANALSSLKFIQSGAAEMTGHIYVNHSTGTMFFSANGAGEKMYLNNGLRIGLPTGGDKGAGTINITGDVYKNNTAYTNPDYALEAWRDGRIIQHASKPGARDYRRMTLGEVENHIRTNLRLPGFTDKPMGMFERGDLVLEKIEELYTHLIELSHKVEAING